MPDMGNEITTANKVTAGILALGLTIWIGGNLIGWEVVGFRIAEWRWTQGWGNLFVVAGAVLSAAIALAALQRSVRNFEQARVDGRHDKLRGEVAALVSAAAQWDAQMDVFNSRLVDLQNSWSNDPEKRPDTIYILVMFKAAFSETIEPLYSQIEGSAYSIRMLTRDGRILEPAAEIHELLGQQRSDARTLWDSVEKSDSSLQTELLSVVRKRQEELPGKITSATERLLDYCTGKFSD